MSATIIATDPRMTYSPSSAWSSKPGVMYTNTAGATAEFSFTGDFVNVFGTIPSVGLGSARPSSTYTVDNSTSPFVFNSADVSNKGLLPIFPFYQSPPGLGGGIHSLLITSTENQTWFILNSIVYGSSNISSDTILPPMGTLLPASPSSYSFPSSSSPSFSSPSSSSTADSDVGSSTSKLPVGGIVGGIIAALILLAGLIAWLLIRRRMNQRTEKHRTVTPFIASRNESRASDRMLLSPVVPQYIDEKTSPPPFVPSPAAVAAQRGSMYKPGGSDVLPPMEFGYGGGV